MAPTPVALTDGIPLVATGGTTGQNNAKDIRTGLLTPIFSPIGDEYVARTGVLQRKWDGTDVRTFKVYPHGTPSRHILIAGGSGIVNRTGEGAYLVHMTTDVTDINCDAADATNPVVEAVIVRLYDKNISADSAASLHGPHFEVRRGAPGAVINLSGTPGTAGAPPVLEDGCLLLAYITRDAGAPGDIITSAKITDKRKSTSLLGAPRVLMGGDLASDAGLRPSETRIRTSGGVLLPPEYWGHDSAWHGTTVTAIPQPAQAAWGSLAAGVAVQLANMAIPDPGYPYKIKAWGGLLVDTPAGAIRELVMQINLDNNSFLNPGAGNAPNAASICWGSLSMPNGGQNEGTLLPGTSGVLTGAHNLYFWVKNTAGGVGMTVLQGYSYRFLAELIPA